MLLSFALVVVLNTVDDNFMKFYKLIRQKKMLSVLFKSLSLSASNIIPDTHNSIRSNSFQIFVSPCLTSYKYFTIQFFLFLYRDNQPLTPMLDPLKDTLLQKVEGYEEKFMKAGGGSINHYT